MHRMKPIATARPASADPFADYVPVKMAHPVVDADDVPELPPSERPRSRQPPNRRKPGRALARGCGTLVFLLCAAVAVAAIAVVSYGYFHDRPLTDKIPMLAACTTPVNALSDWGRSARARLTGLAGTNPARRLTPGLGTAPDVISQSVDRVSAMGARRRERQDEAQRFADGLD